MKKLLFLLLVLSVGIIACNTTEDAVPDPKDTTPTVPSNFSKKVMIEEFTGEWCGACPAGQRAIQDAANANQGRVLTMGLHKASPHDRYESAFSVGMINHLVSELRHPGLSSIGYPTILIGRAKGSNNQVINGFGNSSISGEVSKQLAEEAMCGLKLETTMNGDKLDVKVGYSFKTEVTGQVTLVLALLENNLDGSMQVSGGSGYMHQHVLREMITSNSGIAIDGSTTGVIEEVEFTDIDLSSYVSSECEVIAYIVVDNGTWDGHKILNAQGAHAGSNHDFD